MVNIPADYPNRVNQKTFAALLNISPPMITKHKIAGRLLMDGNKVLVRESIQRIAASKDPARGGHRNAPAASNPETAPTAASSSSGDSWQKPEPEALNYNAEAAREKRASAQLRELELAKAAGELVLKAQRDSAEFTRARTAREAVMSIPDRLATRLAAETSAEKIHAMITEECRRICNALAGQAVADVLMDHAA